MPHAVIYHSGNLPKTGIDSFIGHLHRIILQTGVFPEGGLRVRTHPSADFCCGGTKRSFVHIEFLIGHGRSSDVLEKAGEVIFAELESTVTVHFPEQAPMLSFKLVELHETLNFKKNNLRQYMASRRQ